MEIPHPPPPHHQTKHRKSPKKTQNTTKKILLPLNNRRTRDPITKLLTRIIPNSEKTTNHIQNQQNPKNLTDIPNKSPLQTRTPPTQNHHPQPHQPLPNSTPITRLSHTKINNINQPHRKRKTQPTKKPKRIRQKPRKENRNQHHYSRKTNNDKINHNCNNPIA